MATRECRCCGCTEDNACTTEAGPCHWVEVDLCSACAVKAEAVFQSGLDQLCANLVRRTGARGAMILVFHTDRGLEIAAAMDSDLNPFLAERLREVADRLDRKLGVSKPVQEEPR